MNHTTILYFTLVNSQSGGGGERGGGGGEEEGRFFVKETRDRFSFFLLGPCRESRNGL